MPIHPIYQLILAGESEVLDFKQTVNDPAKIAKALVAFANRKGGRLLIGVRDNKSIAGIRSEDEKYMLDLAASFYCKPEVPLIIDEWELEGKTILEVTIPEGTEKPYAAKGEDGKYWVYIRVKDQSLLASKVVVEVLKKESRDEENLIEYGPKEKGLMELLAKNGRVTLNEFAKKMNISRRRASRILVSLIRAGVIRSHNTEKTEFYTLS
ncbi:MAG: winged helix-turn-helix transcriptional regulator [Bacteroidetes bacterium]|nr:MAG: winged helix-turn-helix transcriptional regulator [Bacteroidota bacterium]